MQLARHCTHLRGGRRLPLRRRRWSWWASRARLARYARGAPGARPGVVPAARALRRSGYTSPAFRPRPGAQPGATAQSVLTLGRPVVVEAASSLALRGRPRCRPPTMSPRRCLPRRRRAKHPASEPRAHCGRAYKRASEPTAEPAATHLRGAGGPTSEPTSTRRRRTRTRADGRASTATRARHAAVHRRWPTDAPSRALRRIRAPRRLRADLRPSPRHSPEPTTSEPAPSHSLPPRDLTRRHSPQASLLRASRLVTTPRPRTFDTAQPSSEPTTGGRRRAEPSAGTSGPRADFGRTYRQPTWHSLGEPTTSEPTAEPSQAPTHPSPAPTTGGPARSDEAGAG